MARTNFSGPLTLGEETGNQTTRTIGFIPCRRVVTLSQTSPSATIAMPPCVITKNAFVPTSAFTGTDPVSAMVVTFAQGSIVHSQVVVSANTRYHESTFVSGAVYDASANMTITLSALSTTVFTGGGGRAYIEYLITE